MERLASVSVDLDSLPHYCRIHGLPEEMLDGSARGLVYRVAVPRFLELWDELGLKGTLFAIGEDLAAPEASRVLAEAHAAGHEVANHSFHHDYALTRRAPEVIAEDVARGEAAIEAAVGVRPVGFRAPGYTLNAALYGVLAAREYAYDSSVFPAAPYWAAKAAVMGMLAVFGRPSRSILDSPRVLLAPREPYRPSPEQPYRRGAGRTLELPMAVTPALRFPFIGTFAATHPRGFVRSLLRSLEGSRHFNFELHAVDLLDASDGIPAALVRQQRDLGMPVREKRERLREVFSWMREHAEVRVLADVAAKKVE